MAGPSWNYVLKFIITGAASPSATLTYVLLNALHYQETQEWASPPSSSDSQINAF